MFMPTVRRKNSDYSNLEKTGSSHSLAWLKDISVRGRTPEYYVMEVIPCFASIFELTLPELEV